MCYFRSNATFSDTMSHTQQYLIGKMSKLIAYKKKNNITIHGYTPAKYLKIVLMNSTWVNRTSFHPWLFKILILRNQFYCKWIAVHNMILQSPWFLLIGISPDESISVAPKPGTWRHHPTNIYWDVSYLLFDNTNNTCANYAFSHQSSGFSFSSCSRFPLRKYYYINTLMTWNDAQHYCREKYTDLATFESVDDIKRLKPDFSYSWAWIGLKDDPKSWKGVMGNDTNSWRWSATSKTSKTGYNNWKGGDPNSGGGKENCVIMGSTRGWHDVSCQSLRSFVCYTGKKRFEFMDFTFSDRFQSHFVCWSPDYYIQNIFSIN